MQMQTLRAGFPMSFCTNSDSLSQPQLVFVSQTQHQIGTCFEEPLAFVVLIEPVKSVVNQRYKY